jgi:hypothetical protein
MTIELCLFRVSAFQAQYFDRSSFGDGKASSESDAAIMWGTRGVHREARRQNSRVFKNW